MPYEYNCRIAILFFAHNRCIVGILIPGMGQSVTKLQSHMETPTDLSPIHEAGNVKEKT